MKSSICLFVAIVYVCMPAMADPTQAKPNGENTAIIRPAGHPIREDVEQLEGGKSPDGQMQVVNVQAVYGGAEADFYSGQRRFEIRDSRGKTIISEFSLPDFSHQWEDGVHTVWMGAAEKVLWRSDSRLVAIAAQSGRLEKATVVFARYGSGLIRVILPPSNAQHCLPSSWEKNGDLVLDLTSGYVRRGEEPPIIGYYSTIRIEGNPPVAKEISHTKGIRRNE